MTNYASSVRCRCISCSRCMILWHLARLRMYQAGWLALCAAERVPWHKQARSRCCLTDFLQGIAGLTSHIPAFSRVLSDSFNMHNWYLCTAAESCRFRSASCTLPCQEILKTLRTTMLCLWRRTTLLLVCGRTFWTKSTPNTHGSRHKRVLVFSLYFLGMVPILKTRIAVSLLWSSTSKKHRFWIKIWSLRST